MSEFRLNAKRVTPEAIALRVCDIGLVASLFLAPLWFGGRHDLGYFLYAAAVFVAAVGAFSHAAIAGRSPSFSRPALGLIATSLGLIALQIIPLPTGLIGTVSPHAGELLPLWQDGRGSLGAWRTISFTPHETREGLAVLTCHALLMLAVATRLRTTDDIRRLLSWIGYAAAAMAVLAFAQYAAPNGKLLWLYSHPHRDMGYAVQGVFSNRNHFAQLMALAVGPLLLLAVSQSRDDRKRSASPRNALAGWGLLALVIVAGLASQSRGGVAAIGVATLSAAVLAWRSGALSRSRVLAAAVGALVVIAGVSVVGYDDVANRMDDLASGDLETLDQGGARRAIWAANADAWRASPLVGFGAGSHRDHYPLFLEESSSREFTHAESGYLQLASETGVAGLVCLAGGLVLFAYWSLCGTLIDGDASRRRLWIGVAPGVLASATQAAVDFVWFTPALTAIVAALAACAMRLRELARPHASDRARRRTHAIAADWPPTARVAGVTMLAALAVGTLWPAARGAFAWDRYLRVSNSLRAITQQLARDPSGADVNLADTMVTNTRHATELLEHVVAVDPANSRARLRLAGRLLQLFELESAGGENGMGVELIADAARNGGFGTHGQMLAWLHRAFGERAGLLVRAHGHARHAVELAPLQGEGYLYLASLSFLDPTGPSTEALIDQALAVRPYDGEVMFEAGRQLHLAGRGERAAELWRACASRPGTHQQKLVMMLAGAVPAADFIDAFDPDHTVVLHALRRYGEVGDDGDMAALAAHARRLAEEAEATGDEPARRLATRWSLVSRTLRGVGDNAGAAEAAQRSVVLAPHVFGVRLEIVNALRAAERYDEADPHLRWCLARRPDIRYLHGWLAEAAKRRTAVDKNRRARGRLYAELAARPREPLDVGGTPETQTDRK